VPDPVSSESVFSWTGSLLSGIGALLGALATWAALRMTRKKDAKEEVVAQEKLKIVERAQEIDAITKRFDTLMDGYENRIKDLTQEVQDLRKEVAALRKALDQRPRFDYTPIPHTPPGDAGGS
jgi:hypothetical protein